MCNKLREGKRTRGRTQRAICDVGLSTKSSCICAICICPRVEHMCRNRLTMNVHGPYAAARSCLVYLCRPLTRGRSAEFAAPGRCTAAPSPEASSALARCKGDALGIARMGTYRDLMPDREQRPFVGNCQSILRGVSSAIEYKAFTCRAAGGWQMTTPRGRVGRQLCRAGRREFLAGAFDRLPLLSLRGCWPRSCSMLVAASFGTCMRRW